MIEKITKDELQEYVNLYLNVKITLIKNREPIFTLKNLPRDCRTLGLAKEIVIHKGKFIFEEGWDTSNKGGSKAISCRVPVAVDYPNQFREILSSEEFLIQDILNNRVKMSSTKYITPIKEFFRKYKVMSENRRGGGKYQKLIKERNTLIIQSYKTRCDKTGKITSLLLKTIRNILLKYARTGYFSGDKIDIAKQKKVFNICSAQIRRIIENNIKKNF